MSKYDMRICNCGHIHMIPEEKISTAIEADKNFLLVCGSCGNATVIGADIEPDWNEPDKDCYMMYSGEFTHKDTEIITETLFNGDGTHKQVSEIYYDKGIRVPMMTGQYATDYYNGRFSDRWYPDFYKIQRQDVAVEEIMKFIDNYAEKRTTVNMRRFVNETPEDMLEEISHYSIDGFNFKGTKWEKKWNSK